MTYWTRAKISSNIEMSVELLEWVCDALVQWWSKNFGALRQEFMRRPSDVEVVEEELFFSHFGITTISWE